MSPQKKAAAKTFAKKTPSKATRDASRKASTGKKTLLPGPPKAGKDRKTGSELDITSLKQTNLPGPKEEKFGAALWEIKDNYYEMNLQGQWTVVGDALPRTLDYSRGELLGVNYARFCDAATARALRKLYALVQKTGQPVSGFEANFTGKDKARRVFKISSALIRDTAGKPAGFGGLIWDITARHRMEEELRRSEERYRTILEDIEEGYAELDLDGNWTFVNETAQKLLGGGRTEILGSNIRQNIADEASLQELQDLYDKLRQTGQSFKGVEIQIVSFYGNKRMTEVSGALIKNENGKPAGFRSLIRDVTERKWAEDALLQSESRYFSIIESIGDAYFETDLRGAMTFINDRACVDLNYTRDELLRMSIRDCQTSENAQKTYEVFTKVYETGQAIKNYQMEASRKDGKKVTFEMFVSLMRDSLGKAIGFRGLFRDITERKKIEDALRSSEERARVIIATIPDPYFENDLHGKFTYVNSAFKIFSGYTDSEIKDASFKIFVDKSYVKELLNLYNSVFKTGLPLKNVELEAVLKNKEKRLVNLSVSLIRDNQGAPTGFSGIVRDITEKRKAEELILQSEKSLREYSETLELRVQERTAELKKSKIAAEEASRAKSDFLAHISYEFQTPLNAIVGFTKVLQDRLFGELNDKQGEFLRYVAEAGATLSRIIAEIVEATQVKSGLVKLEMKPVSITDAISKTTKMLALQIEEKKQVLTVDMDLDAQTSVEGDAQKIRQIFFNILNNAVKYTGEGGAISIHVTKGTHRASREKGVNISFADTGRGIRQEDLSSIFEAFGALPSAYTSLEKGIGVGLSLSKQLAKMHGGDISVESEFGKGSCFTVFLPLKQKMDARTK